MSEARKKNTILGQLEEYGNPLLDWLRVPQKGEEGYKPVTTSFEDIQALEKAKSSQAQALQIPLQETAQLAAPLESKPAPVNPLVAQYLKQKMNPQSQNQESQNQESQNQESSKQQPNLVDKYSDVEYEKAKQSASDRQQGLGWLQFAAGFGDTLAGRNPMQSAQNFEKIRNRIKDETVGEFQRSKQQAVEDFKNKQNMDLYNPNSDKSVAFRKMIETQFPNVAKSYGQAWGNVTAADKENIFEPLKLKENIEARKESMRIAADARRDAMDAKLADKADKKKAAMNEIEDRRQNINANVQKLKQMIDDDGTWEMFGSHNQDMDRLAEQIATDMAKLMDPSSVARPQEVEQIKRTLVKPGFSNKNSTAQDILSNFESEINSRANTAYRIRGLEAPQGRPQAFEGQQPPAASTDSKIDSFMKKNGIKDRNEAIKILKENGKI